MERILQQFQHLKIQLEEITSATESFNDEKNCIGVGGFGKVYKGEVSHYNGRSMAAIKRLDPDRRCGQGTAEFLKEITMLSRYNHENLVSLLGYCYERDEMILVYEYASGGSLDCQLNSPHLTWSQRIKICLDAAKGLSYLHDPRGTHQRLIHCDIKSSNILLDGRWNAKLSDFGLSIIGSANEQHSVVVTNPVGTYGYCDPQYAMTHTLTKESDVYSFGVVLFEVLCGRLCYTYSNGRVQQILVPTWTEIYKQKRLNDVIFKNPTIKPIDQGSLKTISDIAYRCLKEFREDRPKMAEVVTELETALDSQEFSERIDPLFDYEEMAKTVEPPLNYRSKAELWKLLSKGVLLNGGKTWFSLNSKGEHCEMISFAECMDSVLSQFKYDPWSFKYNSRFGVGPYHYKNGFVKTRVKTQFLTPGITYRVNLVFKFILPHNYYIYLKYKLKGETKSHISYLAYKRQDGWCGCELYHFTSDNRNVDLEILFAGFINSLTHIQVEGIEFRPLDKVEPKDEKQNWEAKLPTDYELILKMSTTSMQWTSKKEAYSIICKGFFISDGKKWFYLDKNGKKCHMVSARGAGIWGKEESWLHLPNSRFREVFRCDSSSFDMMCDIQSQLLSPQITYACYLVFKLPEDHYQFGSLVFVKDIGECSSHEVRKIWLLCFQTPVIRPTDYQNTHNPLYRPNIKHPTKQRIDGWMEVEIWNFKHVTTKRNVGRHIEITTNGTKKLSGLIVQGVEFRPI